MSNIHIVKKQNKWVTKKEGNSKSLTKHRTQENAIEKGKKIVKSTGGGELVIHRVDGKI